MIKSTTEKHTINWLVRFNNAQKLDFNIAIQRKEVWDLKHKSNLIASALIGVPIESLLFEEEVDNDGYLVLDGKQRSSSFIQYIRGEFAVSEDCKIKEINGESIIGKHFNELSQKLQDDLKETELTISVIRPLSEDERETIFFMRNQAVSLTKAELTRVLLGSKSMGIIQNLCEHEFLNKTNISRKRYLDQEVMLQCYILETGKDYGFTGKEMPKVAEEIKEEGISEELNNRIISVLDYLNTAIKDKNSSLRRIHIPMVYYVAKQAIHDDIAPEIFNEWVNKFFKDIKGDVNEYTEACNNSSATKTNVQRRLNFIINHYKKNIKNQEIL